MVVPTKEPVTLLDLPQDIHGEIFSRLPSFSCLAAFILTNRIVLESFKQNQTLAIRSIARNQLGEAFPLARIVGRLFSTDGKTLPATDSELTIEEVPRLLWVHAVATQLEHIFVLLKKANKRFVVASLKYAIPT
jgi:hypothetical protein